MTANNLRTFISSTSLCIVIASVIFLPALYFSQFTLAVIGLVILILAFLLFARPFYALLAYVLLIPLEQIAVFAVLGTPTRMAGILFLFTYLYHQRFQINLRVIPIAGWFWIFWVTASLIWSPELNWAYYFQIIQAFVSTILIADFVARSPQQLNTILNSYLAVALATAFLGIYNFFSNAGDLTQFSGSSRTEGFEGQGVEHFAFALIPALFTAFHRIVDVKYRHLRWLNVVLILIFSVAVILSGTRGAWMATIGGLLLVYFPRLKSRQIATVSLVIILSVFVASQIPAVVNFAHYRLQDAISSGGTGRTTIWLVSWQMYLEKPIFGIGWRMAEYTMDLSHFNKVPVDITWFEERFRPRVTHNIYLQNLLELGIIGFIFFMAWLFQTLWPLARNDSMLRSERTLVLIILVAILVGGITNPEFHKKYYWFALALAQGIRYYYIKLKSANAQYA
jgi:exopolysaccharide production protein ExoQ